MPPRQPPADDLMFILGEIKGQLRELIHTSNNTSAKVDGLAVRVAALEGAENRREGAQGVLHTVMKSPLMGWMVGAAISVWAVLTGKVHI